MDKLDRKIIFSGDNGDVLLDIVMSNDSNKFCDIQLTCGVHAIPFTICKKEDVDALIKALNEVKDEL